MIENELLEALIPENARFVSGQDIFLYVPKAQTDRRYGLVKYNPSDFSLTTDGILKLLLPKSQIEDYFKEIRGGTRDETVNANPKINLLNLDKTDKDLYREVSDLHAYDEELHKEDIKLQGNIDYIIQDDRASDADDSTYSAKKITALIREAKMQGLHFVGYIGKTLGIDEDGSAIVKEGALWYISEDKNKPTIDGKWTADKMYKCVNGEWVQSEDYIPSDFDIWKNVDIPDDNINTWWFFDDQFEVLDFNVDMDLYYTKVQSDYRFKSNFTYGDYLYELDGEINIDNLMMPTTSKLSVFDTTGSNLKSTNIEDAVKELEDHADTEIELINNRPILLKYEDTPSRAGDYCVYQDGVYRSVEGEEGFVWELVTYDLDSLLPRSNADKDITNGLEFYNDEETGYFLSKLSLINLNTEEQSSVPISVPVATTVNDGIMPATAMRAISELDIKVEALQSGVKSYFVTFDTNELSQAMLDLLYKEASNSTEEPPNLSRLIDASKNIYYEYYTLLDVKWQGPYIYRYSIANMDQAGLVMSSDEKGKIYVEPVNGVMSLNGYNDIISTFNTLYGGSNRDKIDVSQVPELPASKITSGELTADRLPVVPISKGGTGNTAFSAYKFVITDDTDNSKLKEGTSFGDVDTILVGQGATQLPTFQSISTAMKNYLPRTAGSSYPVTGNLYVRNGTAEQFVYVGPKGQQGIRGATDGRLILGAGGGESDTHNIIFRPNGTNTSTYEVTISNDSIYPSSGTYALGTTSKPWNTIAGSMIYQRNDKDKFVQVANKEDLNNYVTIDNTEQTISGTKKFTGINNTFSKTLVLGAGTPINFIGMGNGTYNTGAFVCNNTDKFGVECPRESNSASAPIIPFRIGARGGQLGILQAGDIYQNGERVAYDKDIPDVSGFLTSSAMLNKNYIVKGNNYLNVNTSSVEIDDNNNVKIPSTSGFKMGDRVSLTYSSSKHALYISVS